MTTLIFMATYNGELFVQQQLDSIAAQTDPDWNLLISDDGSTDATQEHLQHAAVLDERIKICDEDGPGLGPARNFGRLMELALSRDAAYMAFSDQDDVWLPDKLERQLAELKRVEAEKSRACPILIHSDLEIVDNGLAPINASMMRFQMLNHPVDAPPLMLLSQNHVVGCTMLINRALLEIACPVPEGIYMHDWWIALCAASAGECCFMPDPLVRYRQHSSNQIGVQGVAERFLNPHRWPAWIRKMNRLYHEAFHQARVLCDRLKDAHTSEPGLSIDKEWLRQLDLFNEVLDYPRILRPWVLWRIGLRRQNVIMTVLFYLQSVVLRDDGKIS